MAAIIFLAFIVVGAISVFTATRIYDNRNEARLAAVVSHSQRAVQAVKKPVVSKKAVQQSEVKKPVLENVDFSDYEYTSFKNQMCFINYLTGHIVSRSNNPLMFTKLNNYMLYGEV